MTPSNTDRWRNRRAMAWLALLASLLYPLLVLAGAGDVLVGLAGPFFVFTGAVVGSYIGWATMDDKWATRGNDAQ
jgi:hypothetical protein